MMRFAMELLSLPFLLLLALSFFSRPTVTIARGGGHMDCTHGVFARHLFEESQPRISEAMTHEYMSNSELEKAMKEFTQRCANISRIYSIGKSVKGIPLWVVEISDKPGQEEAEPAFKFIGNVHGDEPVGRELLISLANWLCDNYRKDPLATLIVNNVHLHVLPTMNPDGFALRRRGNANNVDLNRDFPDQFYPMNDIVSLRQPETRAIMNWIKERHFTASASLHGGALVANYPWDGSQDTRKQYVACPDDKTFRSMARLYSRSHYNMSLSKEFEGGITNGALWYPIYGGMQDWNYIHGGCFELTLEISDDKWPKANELPVIWEYNRMSMLNLVASLVKTGVHGRIFSSDKGRPLPASVVIQGIDIRVNASRTYGDYHRMLAPGERYEVTASMPGFQSKTTHILLEDEAMNLDFILSPEDSSKHEEVRNECDCTCDGKDKLEVVEFLRGINLGIYLLLSVMFLIFCCLLRRKTMFKFLNRRQFNGYKRSIVV
ncbi:carboxypeptidase SOL1 [Phoenix dactylifera]|uniref:Carboxypeptidase SOL1 n=1 Tax=Phoenix dactylifera TaxID=42345 RepID=A0A8B7C7L3_PHODC|nr:carboxypeptidase SOL1 [Phoenix dactylifera]